MLADYQTANNATTFLKKFCGIDLSNKDTGAITGSDAGGSKIKTGTNVVPNGTFDTSFKGTSFTKRGVTFQLAYQDDKTVPYPSNNYLLKNCNALTAEELHVWQGLYSFWAEESLKLIEESYGYSLTDSDAKFKKIRVFFIDDSSASRYTAKSFSKIYENSNGNYVYLAVNMYYFKHIDPKNLDGKYPYWDDYYLDRLIAHELTHTVMNAKVNSFDLLPAIVVEGLAELTAGMDDSQGINIERAVASKNMLKQLLILQEDYNKVDGINNEDYVAGYLFLRYLAKQSLVRGKNIVSNTANKKVTGTALNDTINNLSNGTLVTIVGGAGNDSIRNSANAKIDGGAGADTLTNTLLGGDGNDYITTYNADSVSIDGGKNNDMIELRGNGKKITVTGGAGNDTISITGGTALVKYVSGNDSIVGFNANSTLQIGDGTGTYTSATSGSNLLLTVGSYKVTLQGAAELSTVRIVGKKVSGKDINNSKSNVAIKGTAYADTIYNTGSKVTINALGGKDDIDNRGANTSINAGAGNDSIYNSKWGSNVTIEAGDGDDTISNDGYNVTLNGGAGNDYIYNNVANVTINAGKGNDSLWGGAGNDTFIYKSGDGKDIINGFDDNDLLKITGTFSASYNSSTNSIAFKVGSTANAIILRDINATSFNVNGTAYHISGSKLVKG